MLFLLPPSETKRDGGDADRALDFDSLSFPSLTRARRSVAAAVVRLARDPEAAMAALRLGPRLAFEVERNRGLRRSPTLAAVERYTGVAYDPLDAALLPLEARRWVGDHVAIHSALFGLLGALDPIPAYRLSHDSRLAGLSLRDTWARPVARALAGEGRPVIDLRSEAYVELGPAPPGSAYVRVVSDEGGRRRALNHFNKKTKGTLVARLAASRPVLESVDDFVVWARAEGIVVERGSGDELVVVAESVLAGAPA
jgi:hypothetical protein